MSALEQTPLVAATPRSGSTLLCELLASTGVIGRPAESFEEVERADVIDLPAPSVPGGPVAAERFRTAYAAAPAEGTTPDVRLDEVAQAVSLWTAVQTARCGQAGSARHEPEFSFAGIQHLVEQLTAQERAWARWFAGAGSEPTIVVDEDLVSAPRKTVHDVLAVLGPEPADVPPPRMRRQSGGRSRERAERYAAEREAAHDDLRAEVMA